VQIFPSTTTRFKDNQIFSGPRGIVGESLPDSVSPVTLLTANVMGIDGVLQQDSAKDDVNLNRFRSSIVDNRVPGYNDDSRKYLEGVPRLPNEPGLKITKPPLSVFHGLINTVPGSSDTTVLVDLRDIGGTVAATMNIPVGETYLTVVPRLDISDPVSLMRTGDGEWMLLLTFTSFDDIRNIFICP